MDVFVQVHDDQQYYIVKNDKEELSVVNLDKERFKVEFLSKSYKDENMNWSFDFPKKRYNEFNQNLLLTPGRGNQLLPQIRTKSGS